MLRLADTTIRLYRRKDRKVSVKLNTYVMVHVKGRAGFRLSTYLKQFDCHLTFEGGQHVLLDEYSFTNDCLYRMEHMIHEFWVSGIVRLETVEDGAARLEIDYRLFSCPGHLVRDR